jgi:hypothetical protein
MQGCEYQNLRTQRALRKAAERAEKSFQTQRLQRKATKGAKNTFYQEDTEGTEAIGRVAEL